MADLRPWATAWGDWLVQTVARTGGSLRYRQPPANRPTLPRLRGARGNTPGVARGIRNHDIRRLSKKRVTG